jgi:hypothetical protein
MAQNGAFSTLKEGTVLTTTGAIPLNAETLEQLSNAVASTEALKRAGYVIDKLTDIELDQKRRCTTCGVKSKSDNTDRVPAKYGDLTEIRVVQLESHLALETTRASLPTTNNRKSRVATLKPPKTQPSLGLMLRGQSHCAASSTPASWSTR